ncbi:MAG: GrpB family protein, partial [Gammaproteobacteria bacterium]|nr:GrpB family protein [Gammaproteobacteria bacterium]
LDYDPTWVARFDAEAVELTDVFGPALAAIHHIGSTAVPGLCAKPTIDILVEVAADTDIPAFDPRMEALGYICRGECLDATVPGTPGRFYFVRKTGVIHLVHAHVCAVGHFEITEMVSFRDYLRSHADAALRYAKLKGELADKFAYDNVGYMRGKDAVVKALIEKSLCWRREADTSQSPQTD